MFTVRAFALYVVLALLAGTGLGWLNAVLHG